MNANEIRQQFIGFFRDKGHEFVPSSPVVPHDDPTLMFANAGMNQFKPIFLGAEQARHPRVANSQKCIRAGGKHNDLDDVGQDTYHHTFFEMLGNWSFGDYFKKEAIAWAWELLTEVWGIPKDRLHATYFQGDESDGLEPDTEAAELWRTVTDIDPSHVHPGSKKDNFWEMGDTGPCGPCSEIHIDLTPDLSGASLVNAGDARVIELWNLVFIQFNRGPDGKLSPLPAKHVDTGMGFERLCAVLQGMEQDRLGEVSNYDTGVFTPIFDAIRKRTGAPAYTGTLPEPSGETIQNSRQRMIDVSYRVIADHIRCLTFALTDGAIPSNEGRGYVLRRILRRAVRYGRQYLDLHEPFLADLVPAVVDHMAEAFPELRTAHGNKNVQHVQELIRDEEESFGKTLDRGIKLFDEAAERALQSRAREEAVREPIRPRKEEAVSQRSRARKEAVAAPRARSTEPGDGSAFPPAYLITFTTYGTWLHGKGKGSVDRDHNVYGTPVLNEDARREIEEFTRLKHDPVTLDQQCRGLVEAAIHEVASHRGWIIRALNVRSNHVHVVVSADTTPERVMTDFKAYATRRLTEHGFVPPAGKTWTRHASTRYLWDEDAMFAAGRYVCEGQGPDLPGGSKPLPYGRGSVESAASVYRPAVISGEDAFKLHDTFGFPIDLTQQMAAERGLTVAISEYERLMEQARGRARSATARGDAPLGEVSEHPRSKPGVCDDSFKYADPPRCHAFINSWGGYRRLYAPDAAQEGEHITFSTDRTCFYAEQGGQVSDRGTVTTETGRLHVTGVVKRGDRVIHRAVVLTGEITHQRCHMEVDLIARRPTMQNHTSTHLLNWALREVLCPLEERERPHVQQKGSLVDPEKTRFDFSHNKPLSDVEIQRIDQLVNEQIEADLPVYTKEVDQQRARRINTLRAVFGEKYPDTVRVVSIGADIDAMLADPKNPEWMKYSVEFCGGTHVKRSGEARAFVLVSEEGVAKGIRRVVGVSGEAARHAMRTGRELVDEAKALFDQSRARQEADRPRDEGTKGRRDEGKGSRVGNLPERVSDLQQRINEATIPVVVRRRLTDMLADLQKAAKEQQKRAAAESGEQVMDRVAELLGTAETINGVKVVVGEVPSAPADKLRAAIDWVRNKTDRDGHGSAVLLATVADGKVTLLAGMSKTVVQKGVKAGDLIKEVAPLVGGKGGGRPDMAQGGGTEPGALSQALDRAGRWIVESL